MTTPEDQLDQLLLQIKEMKQEHPKRTPTVSNIRETDRYHEASGDQELKVKSGAEFQYGSVTDI